MKKRAFFKEPVEPVNLLANLFAAPCVVSGPRWGVRYEDAPLQASASTVLGLDQDLPLTIVQQGPAACAFYVVDTGPASGPRFFKFA